MTGRAASSGGAHPPLLRDGVPYVVLTKRTDTLGRHPQGRGHLPGGQMNQKDADLIATALRESKEEIGLQPADVEIIGRLDDLITVSVFHVTAYVGFIDPSKTPYTWRPQAREVAAVLEVPIAHLLDEAHRVEVPRTRPDGQLVVLEGCQFDDHIVWGATWRMLGNFLEVAVLDHATVEEEIAPA